MPYTEAQKRATVKYKARAVKRIPLDVPVQEYDEIRSAAIEAGESVNGYIRAAVKKRISEEKDSSSS